MPSRAIVVEELSARLWQFADWRGYKFQLDGATAYSPLPRLSRV
jgi:hypothetical protein